MKIVRFVSILMYCFCYVCLFSCGEDEPAISQEEKDKSRGTFTAKVDGVAWSAVKIEMAKNYSTGYVWPFGTSDDQKSMIIEVNNFSNMPSNNNTFQISEPYNDIFVVQGSYLPDQQTFDAAVQKSGAVIIHKLTSDSLVADFNFVTSEGRKITEGKIKISLK